MTKETKSKPLEMAHTFTDNLVSESNQEIQKQPLGRTLRVDMDAMSFVFKRERSMNNHSQLQLNAIQYILSVYSPFSDRV